MCSRDAIINKINRMRFVEYKRLIDMVQPLRVYIGDLGESLIDPELDRKIRYAKERGATISVVTSYIVSKFVPQVIVKTGLDLLNVSIDGATAEIHDAIRGQSCFEVALANMQELIEVRRRLGSQTPLVYLQFVIQKRNYKEIVDYVQLGATLGVDAIVYGPLQLDMALERHTELVGDMTVEEVCSLLEKAGRLANTLGIQTNAHLLTRKRLRPHWAIYNGAKPTPRDLIRCTFPWYSTYIAADGGVYGCCYHRFHDAEVLGNIHESDFTSIWNGPAYQDFRSKMRDGHSPFQACYSCYPLSLSDKLQDLFTNLLAGVC
jgi:radical SAM protein with 4Fe4S-binding SPASM domain